MALFQRGFDIEDRIVSKLERYGCTIQKDPKLDHEHKLDFVLIRFPENQAFFALGVQVTTHLDSVDKQEEFLRLNLNSRVTRKSLYLELSPNVDVEAGGGLAVLTVMAQFQLDRTYANERVVAVRIFDDLSHQFYNLAERVKQLHRQAMEQESKTQSATVESITKLREQWVAPRPVPAKPGSPLAPGAAGGRVEAAPGIVEGILVAFLPSKGFGFIETDAQGTFFVYINSIVDTVLRAQLEALPVTSGQANLSLGVSFQDAGKTRPEAKYPEAKNVRRQEQRGAAAG